MKPSPVSEHDHIDGPADAPVTLIEYGDYECPLCTKAYPVLESVRKASSGKVRFIYRHVPKASQGFLKQAAQAAEFAASQGKFWEMHARLFSLDGRHDLDDLVEAAEAIGLDADACRKALVDHSFAERVRELSVASVQSGIIGTPTLFINGTRYENRFEEPLLHSAVVSALAAVSAS